LGSRNVVGKWEGNLLPLEWTFYGGRKKKCEKKTTDQGKKKFSIDLARKPGTPIVKTAPRKEKLSDTVAKKGGVGRVLKGQGRNVRTQ